MRLPQALSGSEDNAALALLECYYGTGRHAHHQRFDGAWFDTWDSTGTRAQTLNRFTADDLIAVSFLSVRIAPPAARKLLVTEADRFADLLAELGPDRDLVNEIARWDDAWAGWRLWAALDDLPGVGPTRASKLYARKRPRLRPIYDDVVAAVIGQRNLWEPLRAQLQDDPNLHPRLEQLRDKAQLPPEVSAVRVFDVITWMEGTHGHTCPWPGTS